MYVSNRLAEFGGESKMLYVFLMAVFILFVSYVSALAALPFGILFGVVGPSLSFPAYAIYDEVLGQPIPPEGIRDWVWVYSLRFLGIDLGSLDKASFGIPLLSSYFVLPFPPVVSFLFFVSVNVLGAVLGYGFSINRTVREWGNRKTWNLLGTVLGVGLIAVGYVLGSVSYLETGLAAVGGGQYVQYSVTRHPFNYDGWAFLFFGIIVLVIVVLRAPWKRRA